MSNPPGRVDPAVEQSVEDSNAHNTHTSQSSLARLNLSQSGISPQDGHSTIEHQLEVHVQDLFDISKNEELSLSDVLFGIRYIFEYNLRDGTVSRLDAGLMQRLLEGLLLNMGQKEPKHRHNLFHRGLSNEANEAYLLFGCYLFAIEDFRRAVGQKSARELRHHLRIHKRCRASSSMNLKVATVTLLRVLPQTSVPITGWRDLVAEDHEDQVAALLEKYKHIETPLPAFDSPLFPPQMPYPDISVKNLIDMFETSEENGLTSDQVAKNGEHYGGNDLPQPPRPSVFKMLFRQLSDFMVVILIVVMIVELGLQGWDTAIVLGIVVFLNVTIGFSQEWKANRALEALMNLSVPKATVVRDGKQEVIESGSLVPGDIVVLQEGDAVPADGRVVLSAQLEIIESILTGETVAVLKSPNVVKQKDRRVALGDCTGNAFMGTMVAKGRGKMLVTRIGKHTEVGKISSAISQAPSNMMTPIQRKLNKLGKWLVVIAFLMCLLIVVIGLAYQQEVGTIIRVGVSLAVSVVPEGLVAVVTLTMALAVKRMALRKAVVRKLPSVETLGSVTFICSDKTGTLTEGKMGPETLWTASHDTFKFMESTNLDPKAGAMVPLAHLLRKRRKSLAFQKHSILKKMMASNSKALLEPTKTDENRLLAASPTGTTPGASTTGSTSSSSSTPSIASSSGSAAVSSSRNSSPPGSVRTFPFGANPTSPFQASGESRWIHGFRAEHFSAEAAGLDMQRVSSSWSGNASPMAEADRSRVLETFRTSMYLRRGPNDLPSGLVRRRLAPTSEDPEGPQEEGTAFNTSQPNADNGKPDFTASTSVSTEQNNLSETRPSATLSRTSSATSDIKGTARDAPTRGSSGSSVGPDNEGPDLPHLHAVAICALCNNAGVSLEEKDDGVLETDVELPPSQPLLKRLMFWNKETVSPTQKPKTKQQSLEWKPIGDPTEVALVLAAQKAQMPVNFWLEEIPNAGTRVAENAFDSDRRIMSVVYRFGDLDKELVFAKGAPESLLHKCKSAMKPTRRIDASEKFSLKQMLEFDEQPLAEVASAINTQAARMAWQGLRVLALAVRKIPAKMTDDYAKVERDLVFVGLIGLKDPPRPGVLNAVKRCITAGITVVMITGDHIATASSIARDLSILDPKDPERSRAIKGPELDLLNVEQISKLEPFPRVFARVSPDNKLTIVKALKLRGESVAMTGDGVNDAPAIKAADVGVAMGVGGTEITKQAADIVLANDNFATIESAVEEGRRVFDNIRKFIVYLLSCNSAELLVMLVAAASNTPLPFTTMMILWANIIADIPPAMSIGVEPMEADIMQRPPRRPEQGALDKTSSIVIALQGTMLSVITLVVYYVFYLAVGFNAGSDLKYSQTLAFITLTSMQLFQSFLSRSITNSLFTTGVRSNGYMVIAFILSFCLMIMGLYIPAIAEWLGLVALDGIAWGVVAGALVVQTSVSELVKGSIRWNMRKRKPAKKKEVSPA